MNNKQLLSILAGFGLLSLLCFFGLVVALRHVLSQRRTQYNVRQIGPHNFVEYTHEGEPKVGGPLNPGSPTFGYGAAADLKTTDHGWRFVSNPDQRFIFLTVHNNSQKTWHHLVGQVSVYDSNGNYLRPDTCPFSHPLPPGQTMTEDFGPVKDTDAAYSIKGYTGSAQ